MDCRPIEVLQLGYLFGVTGDDGVVCFDRRSLTFSRTIRMMEVSKKITAIVHVIDS